MQWSDIQFNPSRRVLRQFAAAGSVVLVGLGCGRGWARGVDIASTAMVASGVAMGLVGVARPMWLRPVYLAAMLAAFPVGWLFSWVVLGVVYFGVFTPLALAFRLAGRDPLGLRDDPRHDSYWSPKPATTDPGRYLRPY